VNQWVAEDHTLARDVAAWEVRRHRHQASLDGRCTAAEARMKLKSRSPKESG
jgi:hypothetical protein